MKFIRLNNFGCIFSIYEDDCDRIFLGLPSDATLPEFWAQNLRNTNDISEMNVHIIAQLTRFYLLRPIPRFFFTNRSLITWLDNRRCLITSDTVGCAWEGRPYFDALFYALPVWIRRNHNYPRKEEVNGQRALICAVDNSTI